MNETPDYMQAYKGYFGGIKSWDDLSKLWNILRQENHGNGMCMPPMNIHLRLPFPSLS